MDKRPDYYDRLYCSLKVFADWRELHEHATLERDLHRPIVLANGTFDILHPGHLLKIADLRRSPKDYVIVSVDTDQNVLWLKGRMPALGQWDRAVMLAALPGVDAVTFHGARQTLPMLVELLRPDRWHRREDREDSPSEEVAAALGYVRETVFSPRNGEWSSSELRGIPPAEWPA